MAGNRRPNREATMARARAALNRLDAAGYGTAWVAGHFVLHAVTVARWLGGVKLPSWAKLEALEALAFRLCGPETAGEREETEMTTKKAGLVHPSICGSVRVASLGAKGALLYTWMLTKADHQGRLLGGARLVKALVVPLVDDITEEDVDRALLRMRSEGLIILYPDPKTGRELVQVADWWEHNAGMKYVKASKWPPPEDWEDKPETWRDDMGRFGRRR